MINKYIVTLYILGALNEIMHQSKHDPVESFKDFVVMFIVSLLWPSATISRIIVKLMS